MSEREPRLLPPLARARDWVPAGLAAGTCLGTVELLGLLAQGVELPAERALAQVAATAAVVALPCAVIGIALRISGTRVHHSTLAGVIVGPLLATAMLPQVLDGEALTRPVGLALLLAALASAVAAFAGSRLEQAGVPVSGPALWLVVALLLVSANVLRHGAVFDSTATIAALLLGAVILLALFAALLAVLGAQRDPLVPWPWGKTGLGVGLAAVFVAFAPQLLPWLLMDPPGTAIRPLSPTVVVVDLGRFAPGEAPSLIGETPAPNLTILATDGIFYRRFLSPPGDPIPGDWLRFEDGLSVAGALEARGYTLRATVTGASLPPGFGHRAYRDPEDAARVTVGGTLLAGFGLEPSAGNEGAIRRLGAEARRRLATSRAVEPEKPLFLFVDFSDAPRSAASLDDELGRLLDLLAALDLDEGARVSVVWREESADGRADGRAVLRPERASANARGLVVEMPILDDELATVVSGLRPLDADGAPVESP